MSAAATLGVPEMATVMSAAPMARGISSDFIFPFLDCIWSAAHAACDVRASLSPRGSHRRLPRRSDQMSRRMLGRRTGQAVDSVIVCQTQPLIRLHVHYHGL